MSCTLVTGSSMEIRMKSPVYLKKKKEQKRFAYLLTDCVSRWRDHFYIQDVDLRRVFNRGFWIKILVGLDLAFN